MELGRKESIGRPVLYGTTDTFLRSVGIESVETLKQEVATDNSMTVAVEKNETVERIDAQENVETDESVE